MQHISLQNLPMLPFEMLGMVISLLFEFTFTDLPDFLPIGLAVISSLIVVICSWKRWHTVGTDCLAYVGTMLVALLGPALLYVPAYYAHYHGYFPDPHANPAAVNLLGHITIFMGAGNPAYISLHNVTSYSHALAGATIASSVAWMLYLRTRIKRVPMAMLIGVFVLAWVIVDIVPNSSLSYWIG
jgi:prepilin signal peptidase PulO-like enzyme (type II secretory pathway)